MSTSNELETIDVIELSRNLVTEEPARTTRRNSPSLNVLWITPNQITEGSFVWNLLSASNDTDLINSANLWTQTTMYTENFTINDGREDQKVEDLTAGLPDRRIAIFLLTLFVEAIDLGDLTGFVVSTDKCDLVGIPSIESAFRKTCEGEVLTSP
jgi:hypothetical protein